MVHDRMWVKLCESESAIPLHRGQDSLNLAIDLLIFEKMLSN